MAFAIVAQSVYDLRRASYETFVAIHIVLIAVLLAAMYYHLKPLG